MHRIYSNQMEKKSVIGKEDDGNMCVGMKGFGLSKVS